ncbi:MAG: hypothetical protein INR70_27075 [Parafilimonas terrae]|jgi:hypothetical protein|nr:hypothetical protein [Parafilimonas terrae]
MTVARLLAAALAISLSILAARASELEQTGAIDRHADMEQTLEASSDVPAPVTKPANEESTPVALPKLSVTTVEPVLKPLPPLKPLPKWDPHVCIGC